jgi:hypothetical protein
MREQDGVKEKKDLSTAQFIYTSYSNPTFHSIVAVLMKQQHCLTALSLKIRMITHIGSHIKVTVR